MPRKIRLYTDNWEYYADVENDSLFGDSGIIPPVEVLGSIEELLIEGIVAGIIEEEWPYVVRLLEEMNQIVFMRFRYDPPKDIADDYPGYDEELMFNHFLEKYMTVLDAITGLDMFLRGSSDFDILEDTTATNCVTVNYQGRGMHGVVCERDKMEFTFVRYWSEYKTVYMDNISRLAILLTLPHGWEYFVAVDYTTPQHVRMRHMAQVARLMEDVWDSYLIDYRSDTSDSVTRTILSALSYGAHSRDEKYTTIQVYPTYHYLQAIRSFHKLYIGTGDTRKSSIPLYYEGVVWEDVKPLLESAAGSDYRANVLPRISRILEVINGRCTVSIEEAYNTRAPVLMTSSRILEVDYETLFNSILRCYPDDVDPILLGMRYVLCNGYMRRESTVDGLLYPIHDKTTRTCTIDSYIQTMVTHVVESYCRVVHGVSPRMYEYIRLLPEDFNTVVVRLRQVFGNHLLDRVLMSLRLWKEKSDRIGPFCKAIEANRL